MLCKTTAVDADVDVVGVRVYVGRWLCAVSSVTRWVI